MKRGIRKLEDMDGNNVYIPFVREKYDEFYIISKTCLKKLFSTNSVQAIQYFNELVMYLTYNDDRLKLSNIHKEDIRKKLKIDRQKVWKLTKELLKLGVIIKDGDQLKIPADIAWYGDKQTKKNMIKAYMKKPITPNLNFDNETKQIHREDN
jgi:hypothetical protein